MTDLVTHVSRGLSPVLVPLLAAAAALGLPGLSVEAGPGLVLLSGRPLAAAAAAALGLPGLSVEVGPGLVLLSERPFAVAAAAALGLPGLSVEVGLGLVLFSELLCLPFAAAVSVGRLDGPAGLAAD